MERIITARVIEALMKKVQFLSHFSFSYLTGGSSTIDSLTPKMQKTALDSFRSRKVYLWQKSKFTDVPLFVCYLLLILRSYAG